MRLGDLDALKEVIETYRPTPITSDYLQGKNNMVDYCIAEIDNAPTVPLPDFKAGYKQAILDGKTNYSRPQGKWIFDSAGNMQCTNCNFALGNKLVKQIHPFVFSFCPDCGAKMRNNKKETTFDDYLKEQLEDPEFRKEWENLCYEDKQKGGKENG